jgi:integrase
MRLRNPRAEFLYEVSTEDANAWINELQDKYALKTVRDYFKLLRSSFSRMLPTGCENPFVRLVPSRKGGDGVGTVHRKPFSAEELGNLIEAAKQDEFIYPLLVCAMCTGMRRGDVCRLKWSDVDWENGILAVKTSKTGEDVEIPIFNPLREVLEVQDGNDPDYVFPDAVELLKSNPSAISRRFKKLVAIAFGELGDASRFAAQSDEGTKAICAALPEGERRKRIVDVFQRYVAGASYGEIVTATGLPKGTVAQYVRDAQKNVKTPIMRGRGKIIKAAIKQTTQVERDNGRMASVRDWHALRATWVTLALSAGVPVELVRRVTGHATVEVVLKHYFRPDREQFRAALTGALPDVLTGGKSAKAIAEDGSSPNEMAGLLAKIQNGTAVAADKKRFKTLAAKV